MEAGIFFRLQDVFEDGAEASPECCGGGDDEGGEEQLLDEGEVLGFGKGWEGEKHKRKSRITGKRYRVVLLAVTARFNIKLPQYDAANDFEG